MTTKLTEPVFRETSIEIDGRLLTLGLVPATDQRPVSIVFRLKGRHEKSDRYVPVPLLVRLAGWEKPAPRAEQRLSPTEELKRLFEKPELQALEKEALENLRAREVAETERLKAQEKAKPSLRRRGT